MYPAPRARRHLSVISQNFLKKGDRNGCVESDMKENEFPSTIRYSSFLPALLVVLTILGLSVAHPSGVSSALPYYLERANFSYGQLAKVSSIEAKINQFLLSEIATTVNFQNRDQLIKANPELITHALGELQASLENESDFIKIRGGSDDTQEEMTTAVNIASVFIRMHLAARYETKRRASLDSADAVRSFSPMWLKATTKP